MQCPILGREKESKVTIRKDLTLPLRVVYGKPMPTHGNNANEREGVKQEKCAQLSPAEADAIFFPKPGGKSKAARIYCSTCPVIDSCLKRQLRLGGPGFWAGTTEDERRRMAEFLHLVPAELDEFVPPVVRKKVRPVRKDANVLSDPLYGVEGPSPEEELKMLDGII